MPVGAMRMMMGKQAAAGGFNPETSITSHSLFWAGGSSMGGYSDTDAVGTWYNESGESNAVQAATILKPAFSASVTSLNSQPAVTFDGSNDYLRTAAFSANPSYGVSIVAVFDLLSVSGTRVISDGITSSTRAMLWTTTSNRLYAGTTLVGGTSATGAQMWRATFDGSTGDDTLHIDETSIATGAAGAQQMTGVTLGAQYASTSDANISLAFWQLYEGDISSDPAWGDEKTWITDHYGITLA